MFQFTSGQRVGRVDPLLKPEDIQAAVDARSVAAGPLRWNVTMEEMQSFFSQHAKVCYIYLVCVHINMQVNECIYIYICL